MSTHLSQATIAVPPAFESSARQSSGALWAGISICAVVSGLVLAVAAPSARVTPPQAAIRIVENELWQNLRVLRGAIADYRTDRGGWPSAETAALTHAGCDHDALGCELGFHEQDGPPPPPLILREAHVPYLPHGIPINPLNGKSTVWILDGETPMPPIPDGSTGWIYDPRTGEVRCNVPGRVRGRTQRYYDL
ncbi:MAG: hypothetical protein QF903_15605 [Planctomycetota bacterium]|jgi:hypothetical protein|nr:hypothetical protein [Planctomycetota bacterium]MDP6763097.1 hypothetical protein [Planctomycetota bacterium]MDP6990895.1 hypothetical protein [Planctomycetota bacterium]